MSVSRRVTSCAFVVVSLGFVAGAVACEDEVNGTGVGASSSGASSGNGSSTSTSSGGSSSSSGSLPPGTTPPPGAGAEFCQKTMGAVATALEACCTAEDKATDDYGFTHGILTTLLPVCTSTLDASITKGRVLWRSESGASCYAAYQATYAPGKCANITTTFSDPAGESCRDAFAGVGQADAPCLGSHECTDGLTCVEYTKDTDGKCVSPPALGADCGPARSEAGGDGGGAATLRFGDHPDCVAGARCDLVTRKCVKAALEKEDCAMQSECEAPLMCVLGKCEKAKNGDGAACKDGDDCMAGLYCDAPAGSGGAGTCKPKKPAGGTCTGGTFETECAGRCDAAPGSPGTCTAFCGSL